VYCYLVYAFLQVRAQIHMPPRDGEERNTPNIFLCSSCAMSSGHEDINESKFSLARLRIPPVSCPCVLKAPWET
jgi:hypothetical protein